LPGDRARHLPQGRGRRGLVETARRALPDGGRHPLARGGSFPPPGGGGVGAPKETLSKISGSSQASRAAAAPESMLHGGTSATAPKKELNVMSKLQLRGLFCLLIGALPALAPVARAQETVAPLTLDQEYARLAEQVPGFGGLYLDEEGTTHVYLQDLSRAREVQGLGERVEVHQGQYDFRDLMAWKDELRPLLARRGAAFLDIEER